MQKGANDMKLWGGPPCSLRAPPHPHSRCPRLGNVPRSIYLAYLRILATPEPNAPPIKIVRIKVERADCLG